MEQFTSIQYIQIDIANHFGLDKELWSNRLSWVETNDSKLESLISGASSPILYLKAVRAYRDALEGKPINLAVSLDKL